MKRLKSFKQLPHISIHEQESEPEKEQNDETSYNQGAEQRYVGSGNQSLYT